jgi:murein L,D-transpeptidase YafK
VRGLTLAISLGVPAVQGAGLSLASDASVDDRALGITAQAAGLPDEDRMLLLALEAIAAARLDVAERHLQSLLERHPEFRLARLVLADVLMARSGRLVDFASGVAGDRVEKLREEALARIASARDAAVAGRTLGVLLQVAPSQRRVMVVELNASRLYLFENDGKEPRLKRSFYVSIGKNGPAKRREGDQRTPVGVYFVTGRISGESLPDFYGPGALPVNYPNEWDTRHRRTGYGIWIHGVPSDTFARAPRASDGCLALSNEHVALLLNYPEAKNTPVIIADDLDWQHRTQIAARRTALLDSIETWRRDWESLDIERYARHYASDFRSGENWDRGRWLGHKRKVNASKRSVKVGISDLSAFSYPGERDMAVVTFEQDYTSDNYSGTSNKRQYWQREADGRWRIMFEGAVKLSTEHMRGIPYSARSRVSLR